MVFKSYLKTFDIIISHPEKLMQKTENFIIFGMFYREDLSFDYFVINKKQLLVIILYNNEKNKLLLKLTVSRKFSRKYTV